MPETVVTVLADPYGPAAAEELREDVVVTKLRIWELRVRTPFGHQLHYCYIGRPYGSVSDWPRVQLTHSQNPSFRLPRPLRFLRLRFRPVALLVARMPADGGELGVSRLEEHPDSGDDCSN